MKVNKQWLDDWVSLNLDAKEIASLLTMAGLEVDSIQPVAGDFHGVIVAKVLETSPHPAADKLTLCHVDAGRGSLLKVVCGAKNVRAGLKVALAEVGAVLPNGLKIKEAKLRGELSQGMLCSESELGLVEVSEGIMELRQDAPLGVDLREYLSLEDQLFDLDLTPNRGDCLSVLGIARELSALVHQTPLNPLKETVVPPTITDILDLSGDVGAACPYYCGRIIKGINSLAITPLWLQERLRRLGLRSIHPVVDVVNYVMLELGQPMHAFDLNKIKGKIVLRYAQPGESLLLLDDQELSLDEEVLLIADEEKALAIAGVMGGGFSAINETSQDIFIESAYFSPETIGRTARQYKLFTDASHRFERGVDPRLASLALERVSALLLEIVGGQAGPIQIKKSIEFETSLVKKIEFNPEKVKKITGIELKLESMRAILQALGLNVNDQELPWEVELPSYRFDLNLEVDLIEEILRLHGYDRLPGTLMQGKLEIGRIDPIEVLTKTMGDFFLARAYHEVINYSFVEKKLQSLLYPEVGELELLNPISSDLSVMRIGLWPGLIAAMVHNMHRQQNFIKLFEQGVVFTQQEGKLIEETCFSGLISGQFGQLNWSESKRGLDFYDLKGDLQALFSSLKIGKVDFIKIKDAALHPGVCAQIRLDEEEIGICGLLHPRLSAALGISEDIFLFELKLDRIKARKSPIYQKTSKFPQIRRDLSLLVDKEISAAEIEALVRKKIKNDWLKAFDVFDLYQSDSLPAGKKSLAISLLLQDHNRTLIDDEINQLISAIIKGLEEEFAITLRD